MLPRAPRAHSPSSGKSSTLVAGQCVVTRKPSQASRLRARSPGPASAAGCMHAYTTWRHALARSGRTFCASEKKAVNETKSLKVALWYFITTIESHRAGSVSPALVLMPWPHVLAAARTLNTEPAVSARLPRRAGEPRESWAATALQCGERRPSRAWPVAGTGYGRVHARRAGPAARRAPRAPCGCPTGTGSRRARPPPRSQTAPRTAAPPA